MILSHVYNNCNPRMGLWYTGIMPKRINQKLEKKIVRLMALGKTQDDILKKIKKENKVELAKKTLTDIKKRNYEALEEQQRAIIRREAATAAGIHGKTNSMLYKRLEKAEEDTDTLWDLEQQYRNGDINDEEFYRQVSRLRDVSIEQLLKVSKEMYAQSGASAEPGVNSGGDIDPSQAKDLVNALQNSDAVELQRIVFSPQQNPEST